LAKRPKQAFLNHRTRIPRKLCFGVSVPKMLIHCDRRIPRQLCCEEPSINEERFSIRHLKGIKKCNLFQSQLMKTPNSFEVMRNLKEVIREYGLYDKKFSLYCDVGPENRGFTDVLIGNHKKIKKIVTSFAMGFITTILNHLTAS
jgi:hypothetical protein